MAIDKQRAMGNEWTFPRLIAHRAGGRVAPENTLAGMHMAHRHGFDAVEFDVKLTADGRLILLHDDTLERTTNGRGSPLEKTYAEIAALDAGSWFSDAFVNEPVPGYESVAEYCRHSGLFANIEIKPNPGQDVETAVAVARSTREIWQDENNRILISSFSEVSLAIVRDIAPDLPRGLLVEHIPPDWKVRLNELGCLSLHCDYRHLTESLVTEIRNSGYRLLCYTVNDLNHAKKLFAMGVDAIFTDCLDAITPTSLL